jgi:pyruvate-ferredoxin/flavodoxin oxidoreductase
MKRNMVTMDGNAAVAHVAHATNEVIAIYPITPSSAMGEYSDEKTAHGETNIWGTVPIVTEMQSEGGAAAAVHGALTTGALATTFTASQGLLLMIPTMFKIAGELTSTVFHVSARSIACQALSIFGDHSDVMAVRSTGFGLIASNSPQEVMDFALIAQAATLESRVPFVHFFDGFRTSSELQKIEELTFDDMRAMIDDDLVAAHKARGMSPDKPILRGTSQNPDVYFQGRETVNRFYLAAPAIVQKTMDKFAGLTGRHYRLFDYAGHPEAEDIIIMMGSGAETADETVEYLTGRGEKVGLVKVRLFRPFSAEALAEALPSSVKRIAVLDRTKEPGALGEPLYLDVRTAVGEAMAAGKTKFSKYPLIIGGRYGLSSKELTPGMVKGVFDNLKATSPKNHFTIGIVDDVTQTSLDYDRSFDMEGETIIRAMFYGLGADGTVGANKNSIAIIGDNTDNYAQAYFVYDSKKAGAVTVSHLRFGPKPIRRPYLIASANFIACHNFTFLERYDMLSHAKEGAYFLLNSPFDKDTVWDKIPMEVQQQIIDRKLKFYVIDAIRLAEGLGLGVRINSIMQAAFFAITKIIPVEKAVEAMKDAVKKTYGKKGEKVLQMNYAAIEAGIHGAFQVSYPSTVTSKIRKPPIVSPEAPDFVQQVTARIMAGKGDELPVSLMPPDGTYPVATTQWEKRNIAVHIPVWLPEVCIQCGQCSLVCPHATIRLKVYDEALLKDAPPSFRSTVAKGKQFEGRKFTVQVAPEDCTGCGVCVQNCPGVEKDAAKKPTGRKAINMELQLPLRETERKNYEFFLALPETDPALYDRNTVKGSQLARPLFEYSGACAGCGETPYLKLLTQLFGNRAIIGNATGCSSIYGGNLPTTPYSVGADGRGPSWSNSLFEDTAEFALGMRLTVDKFDNYARGLVSTMLAASRYSEVWELLKAIEAQEQNTYQGIEKQMVNVAALKEKLGRMSDPTAKQLLTVADYLVKKSIWGVGGDGWAYDIGFGGLDHVLALGYNVNLLVLDTEVYSNTGGQMSKSTPLGAVAKFAAGGKPRPKKDLGMIAMTYGNVYVARVALGANMVQCVKAFVEAEAHEGCSIIIAYSTCIAHGIDMSKGLEEQKKAVACGYWPLYRYNPALADEGKNPLIFESKAPTIPYADYAYGENRFRTLKGSNPEAAARLLKLAEKEVAARFRLYQQLAAIDYSGGEQKKG